MEIQYHCTSFDELTKAELYAILALRQEVFIVEQHCPYLDADGKDLLAWHLRGMTPSGELATYARLLPAGTSYEGYASIGRVITAPFARNKGLGRPLMNAAIGWMAAKWPAVHLKISAQAHLQGYYASVGFVAQGDVYLEDGIPHIAMVR
jgi:ElaA protein